MMDKTQKSGNGHELKGDEDESQASLTHQIEREQRDKICLSLQTKCHNLLNRPLRRFLIYLKNLLEQLKK